LAGRRFERRFEAADNPFADRQADERSRIAAPAWEPGRHRLAVAFPHGTAGWE
jgi:hypothetical protein